MIRGSGRPACARAAGERAQVARRAAATGRRRPRSSRRARTRGTSRRPRARATRARPARRARERLAERALVRGSRVGVQQADRDRLRLAGRRPPRRRARRHPVERAQHAVRADALGRAEAQLGRRRAARARPRTAGRGRARAWRPSSTTSVKPSVATSAVRAPRPSSSALVATVIPWAKRSTSPGCAPGALEHRARRRPCTPSRLVVGRRRRLGGVQRCAVDDEDGVGERAADVDAEEHAAARATRGDTARPRAPTRCAATRRHARARSSSVSARCWWRRAVAVVRERHALARRALARRRAALQRVGRWCRSRAGGRRCRHSLASAM